MFTVVDFSRVPIAPIMALTRVTAFSALALVLLLLLLSVVGCRRLRGTTLAIPCLWVAFSAVGLLVGLFSEAEFSLVGVSAARFCAACTTFCPLMAVLGAKRPQDRGWQWVVVTLWIVLIWPALQAALLPAGIRVELFIAWKVFLWGMIGLGLLNYLPTRHWAAAMLVAAGQLVLLHTYLGIDWGLHDSQSTLVGLGCFTVAALLAFMPPRRREASPGQVADFENAWLSFRDSYGAFWALRILGRVNHAAELREWPLRLHWDGFAMEDEPLTSEQRGELRQTMSTLLRRFVAMEEVGVGELLD